MCPYPGYRFYQKELNQFSGFVLKDEVMEMIIEKKGEEPLKTIARPITAANEDTPIIRLFSKLIERKAHIAIVEDMQVLSRKKWEARTKKLGLIK